MTIVAHTHPFVIGVDTHARNHALAILAAPTGEVLDDAQFPATAAGLARAVSWAARRTSGDLDVLWVIEGVGTYEPPWVSRRVGWLRDLRNGGRGGSLTVAPLVLDRRPVTDG
jgi:hypothetical protein